MGLCNDTESSTATGTGIVYPIANSTMKDIHAEYADDWEKVPKTVPGHRVEREAFVNYLWEKNEYKLTKEESKDEYRKFLHKCFDCCTSLMLPADKKDLGRHCFTYGNLMSGEFYFAAAERDQMSVDQHGNPACTRPVEDVLKVCK